MTTTSTHSECGEPILWTRKARDTDAFMPPLEATGEMGYVVVAGVASKVPLYRLHVCDPESIERQKERQAEAERWKTKRDIQRTLSMLVECPKCPAGEREPCLNLSVLRLTGDHQKTASPHDERMTAAGFPTDSEHYTQGFEEPATANPFD